MKKTKKLFFISLCFLLPFLIFNLNTSTASAATKQKGFVKEKDGTHYYYNNGKEAKGGKAIIKGKTYFFNKKGVMRHGWYTTKRGNTYYLSKKDGSAFTGKKKVNGKWYIFSAKGAMKKGWYKDKKTNKKYYLSTKNGVMKTGFAKIDGKYYYFGRYGTMQRNKWYKNPATGKKYYFGSKGYAVKGVQYIKGKYYVFGKYCTMKTGWYKDSKGNKYYLGKDGAAYTGKHQIDNNWYYFKKNGVMSTGKVKAGNCLYYSDEKGIIYRTVDGSKKMVALTFDDGPSPYTPIVLDTLEKYNAVATFFLVGNRVSTYASYAKREYELGCEVATHTYDHAWLTKLSAQEVKDEITKSSNAIKNAIGVAPTLMRPPGGLVNSTVSANVGLPMIMWSVDTEDWRTRNSATTNERVQNWAYDGAIILVHDLHQSTAIASKTFIPGLINKGYQLVTVSELAELRGVSMEAGTQYYSFK
jgi:peptidoglycan/xylan/chitin deacetylase (PgdA/CDA1 family)